MAAINAFDEPIVLLLGGRDKKLPWEDLAKLIQQRVDHVVVFGEAADLIQKAVATIDVEKSVDLHRVNDLKQAVLKAAEIASAGDVVLFSPGGTSYDAFKDFAERGESFIKWIQEL
jgi:UDP-N-acetylmuramoylalanine--D-glutamate ligase